ncbi:MAG TPA: ABC transporter substrate-binding protein [Clostridiaceae bacterium]|nr:ABC transporter substrate-binding protein [Clostridiaceae bacterium]
MKRKGRIVISIALMVSLMITALAGCSKKQNKGSTNGNKPELRALMGYASVDLNTYPSAKVLEQRTGYKVHYDTLPQDRPIDKLNLIISSGENYDFITYSNAQRYTYYAKEGALLDLDTLIEKYGKNIKKNIAKESFDAIRIDGKCYAIPDTKTAANNREDIGPGNCLAVRQDWLDKLGLKVPTTIDEFTAMLQAFKDKDPGNRSSKNVPFVVGQSPETASNIMGAFGIPNAWNDVNGELVPNILMPGYKDYLSYMIDLYKKGLIDKEFPTNTLAVRNQKFTSGNAGVMALSWSEVPNITDALKKNIPDAKLTFIPPLKGKDGKIGIGSKVSAYMFNSFTYIPQKTSKHAEDVIKYFDLKLDDETFKLFTIGEEGKHYTVKDGKYYPIQPIFFKERGSANYFLTGSNAKYSQYWLARLRKDQRLYDAYMVMNVDYAKYFIKDPTSTAGVGDLVENSKNSPVLDEMAHDYMVKVITGTEPLSSYDEFIKDWKAKGGEACTNEVNDWYKTKK